ncbi:MAG: phosphotransferase enzyme family protein [Candidatus Cryptobacteroides sp.]
MAELSNIVSRFGIEGEVVSIEPLGSGLINDTYKVATAGDAPDYVLQRINNAIFKDVALLQGNIEAVTGHIRAKLEAAGESDIDRKVLRFIKVKDTGFTYLEDEGKFWRVSVFIPDAYTYETVNPEYSYCAGKAFGNFEAMLADIPDTLGETIPDFHNMELRLSQLIEAVENDAAGRIDGKEDGVPNPDDPDHSQEVLDMLEDIDTYGVEMCKAERLHRDGVLPKRICHCDTKVNNMMFDRDGNILCVIDLDTVMPSFVFSDFGDFLRTAANTAPEDEPDVEKIHFNMEIFKAFAKGYIESAGCFLTDVERENLPYAACMFPFMQAVRFLADYINGDTYYKTKYIDHNFVRARAQMTLFHSALEKVDEMKSFIDSL